TCDCPSSSDCGRSGACRCSTVRSSAACTSSRWWSERLEGGGTPNPRRRHSHQVEVVEAGEEVLLLGLVAVQLDGEPKLVHRVGIAHRVLVADDAPFVQVEQRLVE